MEERAYGNRSVARPLAEEAHGEDKHSSVSCFAGVEELTVVPPTFVGARDGDVFNHFFVFEFDDWMVAAAFAVVSCLFSLLASCFFNAHLSLVRLKIEMGEVGISP